MRNETLRALLAAGVALGSMSGIAAAQVVETERVISLTGWDYNEIYADGRSIKNMLDDGVVYGPGGEEIGSVENVLFSTDGNVLSIIAQVGGLWDIGDTHVNVPWDQVEIAGTRVTIPVTEETVDEYSLYADELITRQEATGSIEQVDDDVATAPRVWRATELIGDYVRVRDEDTLANYGYVEDLIVRDTELAAVAVRPDVGWTGARGAYAYPYYGYGYGWYPGRPYYDMPYTVDEVGQAEQFDYERVE